MGRLMWRIWGHRGDLMWGQDRAVAVAMSEILAVAKLGIAAAVSRSRSLARRTGSVDRTRPVIRSRVFVSLVVRGIINARAASAMRTVGYVWSVSPARIATAGSAISTEESAASSV